MRLFHILIVVLLLTYCSAPELVKPATEPVSEQASFVDSINTHFYKIYSEDFQKAKELTTNAVNLSVKNGWAEKEALAQKNLSVIMYMMGYYDQSLNAALRAYDIYDSLNDKSGLARVCNEMGNYYRKQGENEKALKSWYKAERLAVEANDMEALGTAYGMLGTYFWLQKDYSTSDEYYMKCYDIRLQEEDSIGLGYVLIDLADMEQRKGNIAGALAYFQQSNAVRQAINDYQGLVDNYKMIGDLYMKESSWTEAITYYKECAAHCMKLSYPDLARKSYDSLASAYFYLENFEKAYHYSNLSDDLQDSLFNLEKTKAISELQTKYETEKKEQQITLQQAEIAEQKAQNQRNTLFIAGLIAIITLLLVIFLLVRSRLRKEQFMLKQQGEIQLREAEIEASIRSQEKERSRFAKDLHDGFGQMISVLNLNLHALQETNADRHEVFDKSTKVLDEMYGELKSICFNLMPQTLIQHGLGSAIREFAGRINATGRVFVTTDVFGLDERLTEVQEISLYRITQEWVNNILKYSDADKITIQVTRDEAELTLLIEDNGVGFDAELLKSGKGNGWRNMQTRANLIKGELELDTAPRVRGNALILNAQISALQARLDELIEKNLS